MIRLEVDKSIKGNSEYSVFASSPYNSKLVEILRSLPIRYYDTKTKEWEIPSKYLDTLCGQLKENKFKYELINNELLEKPKNLVPADYKFKTDPFTHQTEAIEFGLNHNKWLLGDSMGLGKTKVAIDIACIKKQKEGYTHCLIVCGVNGLKWNWIKEIETHSNESYYLLGQKQGKDGIHIGSTADKLADISNLKAISEYFIIVNIETFRDQKCALELKKQASNGELSMIVLDEAHVCKNPSSQQGKGILKLSAKTMIAMTGTPLMNNPLDLYFIMKWLGYENHSFYQFKNYHCIMGGYGGYEILGYRHMDEIQNTLNEIMLRRLKEDVFDLPDKVYINEYVEMSLKQKQIYKEVKQEISMNIDKIAMSNNPLTELIRLRQATGYPGILSSKVQESAKLDRLEELVEEATSNNQKVVIFSNWIQITNIAYDRLLNKGFVGQMITGETKDESRQHIVEAFQTSKYQDFIIGTIGAMGTGITLTAGTVEIFLDEPWTMASKEQAVDRCHRIGTKNNITIYTLLAKDTIDEKIHTIVQKKGLMADAIVDGRINMDKKELIDFLLN